MNADPDDLLVSDLEMSVRTQNVLSQMGIRTLKELRELKRYDAMRTKGCGQKTWSEIRDIVQQFSPPPAPLGIVQAVKLVNDLMVHEHHLRLVVDNGELRLYRRLA